MLRLRDIAAKHGDDVSRLVQKARSAGFPLKTPSRSLDKISAEAIELAVYGKTLAVRFEAISGAKGRLAHMRRIVSSIEALWAAKANNEQVVAKAKGLANLLAVCKTKDSNVDTPAEWAEAERLLRRLEAAGVDVRVDRRTATPAAHGNGVPRPRLTRSSPTPQRRKPAKGKRTRKRTKNRRRPKLIFTAFETNRRRH